MSYEISWVDMCRGCMEVEGTLFPLYNDSDEFKENDLPSKLTELTSVEMSNSDGLPTKLCATCIQKTNAFFEFKCLIQDTDQKLRHMLNEQLMSDAQNDADQNQLNDNLIQLLENDGSLNNNRIQITVVEASDGTNNFIVKNLNEIPSDLLLKIDKSEESNVDTNGAQDLQFILQSDSLDLNNIDDCQFIENQNPEIQETEGESCHVSSLSDPLSFQTPNSESLATAELELIGTNDSDSEGCEEIQDNTVGTLNDTITRIKEIKKGDNLVQYQCTLCLQNYQELYDVLSHIVNLHVPKTGPFYCVVCEADCSSMEVLKNHITKHTGPSPYICFICNKAYIRKRYLKRHLAIHDFPKHRCAKCGDRFKVKNELDTHICEKSKNFNESPYSCSQCPRKFNHKGNYKRHLMASHLIVAKFSCHICNKRFVNNRALTSHIRCHTGEKPFQCPVCQKSFSQEGNLFNHKRIHSNPRNFTCEVCGKSFNQRSTLKDHSVLHSGEKPHRCNICGLCFTFSASLRRHKWVHSNKKPFECSTCDAKFVAKYDLKRHMKSHNGKPKIQKNKKIKDLDPINFPEMNIVEDPSQSDTNILVDQILLCNDSIEIISEDNAKKNNVDALFGLI